jgi:translation initiation factor IF-3
VPLPFSQPGRKTIVKRPLSGGPASREPKDAHRINNEINAREVRLIDADGEPIGVVNIRDALARAADAGLDLVEIAAQAEPPVCKLLDYGKFKYEEQKKKAEARKKQKVIEVKEVKFRPNIEENDFQVKLRNVRRFLEEGNKVKVFLTFRGREMTHQEIGVKVMDRLRDLIAEEGKIEQFPKLEGRHMIMVVAPVR